MAYIKAQMKNITGLLIVLLLVVLSLFLVNRHSSMVANVENKTLIENHLTSIFRPEVNHSLDSLPLMNSQTSAEKRIQYILDLNVEDLAGRDELLYFINSPNAFAENVLDAHPHSIERLKFEKEQAVRIFAIRKLSESLTLNDFKESVSLITKMSQDEDLKELAQMTLDARMQGENYFENMILAIGQNGFLDE